MNRTEVIEAANAAIVERADYIARGDNISQTDIELFNTAILVKKLVVLANKPEAVIEALNVRANQLRHNTVVTANIADWVSIIRG